MATTLNDDYPKKSVELSDDALKSKAIEQFQKQQHEQAAAAVTTNQTSKFPTEIIKLPSQGKYYPAGHPLADGTVEMKYMTAREEDILTNQSYIRQGVVLDKLFQSLLITQFDYNDLLVGDKNAIMIAARVLGYGKEYEFTAKSPSGKDQPVTVDLTKVEDKQIDWDFISLNQREFELTLPACQRVVTVQLVTHGVQKKIDTELKGLEKLKKDATVTTMLKHVITSIDGDTKTQTIRHFVDNELFAIDSRYIRNKISEVTPDVDLSIELTDEEDGYPFRGKIAIGLDFFWPDSKV